MTRRRIVVHEAIELKVSDMVHDTDMDRNRFVVVVCDPDGKLLELEYERQSLLSDLHAMIERDAERNHWTILTVRAV